MIYENHDVRTRSTIQERRFVVYMTVSYVNPQKLLGIFQKGRIVEYFVLACGFSFLHYFGLGRPRSREVLYFAAVPCRPTSNLPDCGRPAVKRVSHNWHEKLTQFAHPSLNLYGKSLKKCETWPRFSTQSLWSRPAFEMEQI